MTESTIERMRASSIRRGLRRRVSYVLARCCTHIIAVRERARHPRNIREKESAERVEIEKVFVRVARSSSLAWMLLRRPLLPTQPPPPAHSRTQPHAGAVGELFLPLFRPRRGKKSPHGRKNAAEKCACSLRPQSFRCLHFSVVGEGARERFFEKLTSELFLGKAKLGECSRPTVDFLLFFRRIFKSPGMACVGERQPSAVVCEARGKILKFSFLCFFEGEK